MTKSEKKAARLAKAAAAATAAPTANPTVDAALSNAEGKLAKKQKKQDESNKETLAKKITKEKDLAYIYPEDVDSLAKRKKFRTAARSKRDSYLAKIEKAADKKARAEIAREYNEWAKTIFVKPELAKVKVAEEAIA